MKVNLQQIEQGDTGKIAADKIYANSQAIVSAMNDQLTPFCTPGSISYLSGFAMASTGAMRTDFIRLLPGKDLAIRGYDGRGSTTSPTAICAFYNADFKFISSWDTGETTSAIREIVIPAAAIPAGAIYIRSQTTNNGVATSYIEPCSLYANDYGIRRQMMLDEIASTGDMFQIQGYAILTTGVASATAGYECTDYLPLNTNCDIIVSGYRSSGNVALLAYYDENKRPLSVIYDEVPSGYVDRYVISKTTFPANAAFIRCSGNTSYDNFLYNGYTEWLLRNGGGGKDEPVEEPKNDIIDLTTPNSKVTVFPTGGMSVNFPVHNKRASFTVKAKAATDLTTLPNHTVDYVLLRMRPSATGSNICFDARFRKTANSTPLFAATPMTYRMRTYDQIRDTAIKGSIMDNTAFEMGSFEKDVFSVRLVAPTSSDVGSYIWCDKANGAFKICASGGSVIYNFPYSSYSTLRELFDAVKETLPTSTYEVLDFGCDGYTTADLAEMKVGLCKMTDYYIDNVSQGRQVPDSFPAYASTYKKDHEFEFTLNIEPDPDVDGGTVMRYYVNGLLVSVFRHTAAEANIYNNRTCTLYIGRSGSADAATTLPEGVMTFLTYEYRAEPKPIPRHIAWYFHNIYGTRIKEYDGIWLGGGHEDPEGLSPTSTNYYTTYGRFARLLKDLTAAGFVPMSPREYADAVYGGKELPLKTFSFHFDDGLFDPWDKRDIRDLFTDYGVKPIIYLLGYSGSGSNYMPAASEKAKIIRQAGWDVGYHGIRHYQPSRMIYSQLKQFIDDSVAQFNEYGISADQWAIAFSVINQHLIKTLARMASLRFAYYGSGFDGYKTSLYPSCRPHALKRAEASDYAPYSGILNGIKELEYVGE